MIFDLAMWALAAAICVAGFGPMVLMLASGRSPFNPPYPPPVPPTFGEWSEHLRQRHLDLAKATTTFTADHVSVAELLGGDRPLFRLAAWNAAGDQLWPGCFHKHRTLGDAEACQDARKFLVEAFGLKLQEE